MRSTMRYPLASIVRAVALLAITTLLTGCGAPGPAYDGFLHSADTFVNRTGGPVLEAYLAHDATLDEGSRQIRAAEIATFREAVAAAIAERAQP